MTGRGTQTSLCLAAPAILAIYVLSMAHAADIPDAVAAGWKGKNTCDVLHEDEKIRILRCTFPPKIGHQRHFHPSAFSYVLSGGRFQVTDSRGAWQWESVTDEYRAGMAVQWHEVLNIGKTTLRYLIVEMTY